MAKALSIVTDFGFDDRDREVIRTAAGSASRVEFAADAATLRRFLAHADVLCTFRPPIDLLRIAPQLRWLQYPGTGVDPLQHDGLLREGLPFTITTVSSANAEAVAEFVIGMMLLFARNLDDAVRLRDRREWAAGRALGELRGVMLEGRTLGIVGLGAIGRRVAQVGNAFRMRTIGMRYTSRPGDQDPDCTMIFGAQQLHELLSESDYVVVSVPLTQQTTRMIDEAALRAMRPNALLINVARGEVVDEPTLIRALRERWIAGAALDVVTAEPLVSSSPLWALPNVFVTPHLSGLTTGYSQRVAAHFAANIRRFQQGETLLDRVDPVRGY